MAHYLAAVQLMTCGALSTQQCTSVHAAWQLLLSHIAVNNIICKVMQLAPGNAEAWMRLGSCRFQLEQFTAAIQPLKRAAQLLTPADTPSGVAHLQDTLWLLIQVNLFA